MLLIQEQKSEEEHTHEESAGDLPPAYDALSHPSTSRGAYQSTSLSAFPESIAGPSGDSPHCSNITGIKPPGFLDNKTSPSSPSSPDNTRSSTKNGRPRARKNTSWLSLLPFASTFSAKRVRQSVLSILSDLAVPPSRVSKAEQRNVYEMLASVAETCAEHKLSLSSILQEKFVADHTPMYWAVVNYRQELLVALLIHARPLSIQTISDIRRACLASSNQGLFHALRICRPPFHSTDGIRMPGLRAASENLLLDNRPLDEVRVLRASDRGFAVSFDIPLWQRRMRVIGQASTEFIVSGRMWSISFFSSEPSSAGATLGKSKQSTWHVMVSLLESSLPTFFDSQFVVEVPPPHVPDLVQTPRIREARSTTFPSSRGLQHRNRVSMYDHDHDGKSHSRLSRDRPVPAPSQTNECPPSSSSILPPPIHPTRGSSPPISIRLGSGSRKLARRPGRLGEPPEKLSVKPETWSDQGVGYTNAVVSPLGGLASQLLYDHSRYLFLDGTLRGRLEARFVKSDMTSRDCIIC